MGEGKKKKKKIEAQKHRGTEKEECKEEKKQAKTNNCIN